MSPAHSSALFLPLSPWAMSGRHFLHHTSVQLIAKELPKVEPTRFQRGP